MGFYRDRVLPHVIDCSMRNVALQPYRERLIAQARGRVLEIGLGSGLNLPLYGRQVTEIVGIEPSPRLRSMAQPLAAQAAAPVTLVGASAERLPVDGGSVDTVVTTWTLCSIVEALAALKEMRRVLRMGGQLLFVEHGLAPEQEVQRWQHRLTPLWKVLGGGCHLNRPIRTLIDHSGFEITQLHTGYAKGPRPMGYMYEGHARPA